LFADLSPTPRQVLVEIVRFTQKNGLKGSDGGWKDFLVKNDRKLGSSASDPKKRTRGFLLAFLLTFSKDFQKVSTSVQLNIRQLRFLSLALGLTHSSFFGFQYFAKLANRHLETGAIQQHMKMWPHKVSLEQVMFIQHHDCRILNSLVYIK
jgi:RNA exonuclease 1